MTAMVVNDTLGACKSTSRSKPSFLPVRGGRCLRGGPHERPECYTNIHSVSWRTPPPPEVGSKLDVEARFLGRRLAYTYEIVDLEQVAGGALMKLRNRGAPSGFAKVAAPMVAKAMKSAMGEVLDRLARRLASR